MKSDRSPLGRLTPSAIRVSNDGDPSPDGPLHSLPAPQRSDCGCTEKSAEGIAKCMTPRQRRVVELLRSEATDEQVARSLGVSVRTVRKDVSVLMTHFNVHTRFALGGALVRHDGRCRCSLPTGTI